MKNSILDSDEKRCVDCDDVLYVRLLHSSKEIAPREKEEFRCAYCHDLFRFNQGAVVEEAPFRECPNAEEN